MLSIHHEPDFDTAAQHAADAIVDALTLWHTDAILLLFSGGSPLEIVKRLPSDLFTDRVTIGVSDERYSMDPAINNFAQIQAIPWYEAVKRIGVCEIDTRPKPEETLEQLGARFDGALKTWRHNNPSGKIIITQGVGLDGHTAGMMPYPEDPAHFNKMFIETNKLVVGYDAKEKNKYPLRVTTTVPFLLSVDLSVVFACGEDKQKPLEDVFAKKTDISAIPGRIIHQMKHCLLYTDLSVDTVNTQGSCHSGLDPESI